MMNSGLPKPIRAERDRFLKVPYTILVRPDISANEKLLLAHIWSYGTKGCWESNDTIGRMFGVTPRQVTTWIGHLKKADSLLWLHGRSYHRILWAREHPEVARAPALPCRGRMIPKKSLRSGHRVNVPPRRILPCSQEDSFPVTRKDPDVQPGRELPQTSNMNKTETTRLSKTATGHERAPALLTCQGEYLRQNLASKIGRIFKSASNH